MIFRGATFEVAAPHLDFLDEADVRYRWWNPAPGDVVVDVGAGRGSYTLTALALGAHVIAFSPEEGDTSLLMPNLAANPAFADRWCVLRSGLHSKVGALRQRPNHYEFIDSLPNSPEPGCFPVCPLDMFNLNRVDWIKIDVEGAELLVLQGAEATIRQHRPRLLVENHKFMDAGIEEAVTAFVLGLDVGYTVETHPYESVSHSFFEVKR